MAPDGHMPVRWWNMRIAPSSTGAARQADSRSRGSAMRWAKAPGAIVWRVIVLTYLHWSSGYAQLLAAYDHPPHIVFIMVELHRLRSLGYVAAEEAQRAGNPASDRVSESSRRAKP